MIEIIGEIRDATPEEMERFRRRQKEQTNLKEEKGEKMRVKNMGEEDFCK